MLRSGRLSDRHNIVSAAQVLGIVNYIIANKFVLESMKPMAHTAMNLLKARAKNYTQLGNF